MNKEVTGRSLSAPSEQQELSALKQQAQSLEQTLHELGLRILELGAADRERQ